MTSRGQCPRGVVLVNVFTPPPPLQEILYPRLVFHPSKFRPPPPTWMAGYGPAGLHLPLLAGWGGGNDKLAIDKGGNLPEKVENHCYRPSNVNIPTNVSGIRKILGYKISCPSEKRSLHQRIWWWVVRNMAISSIGGSNRGYVYSIIGNTYLPFKSLKSYLPADTFLKKTSLTSCALCHAGRCDVIWCQNPGIIYPSCEVGPPPNDTPGYRLPTGPPPNDTPGYRLPAVLSESPFFLKKPTSLI